MQLYNLENDLIQWFELENSKLEKVTSIEHFKDNYLMFLSEDLIPFFISYSNKFLK